jgi:hypothetical protein
MLYFVVRSITVSLQWVVSCASVGCLGLYIRVTALLDPFDR